MILYFCLFHFRSPEPSAAHDDAQMPVPREPADVSPLKEEALDDTATLEESSSSLQVDAVSHDNIGGRLSPGPGPLITSRRPCGWPKTFIIRTDREGSVHMYPPIGGPFQSLQEADDAIVRHLDDLRDKTV